MNRREVRKSDLGAIRKLVYDTGVFSEEEVNVAVELAEDAFLKGIQSDYHFLISDISDDAGSGLSGYTCFGRIPFTDERYDLYWIVVNKKCQHRGIASQLLQDTEAIIHISGGKMLYAETSSRPPYLPAQSFYRKHYFNEVARLKNFYKEGDDKIIFGKSFMP